MRRLLNALLVLSLILISGCSNQDAQGDLVEIRAASMTKLDDAFVGDAPLRVVAVGNGVAELIVAMGLQGIIVGRDIASEIKELASIPIVTNGHDLSAEKVLAESPDLLIVDPNTSPKSSIRQIQDSGVRVVEIPESFQIASIKKKVELIASAIGQSDRGLELNLALQEGLRVVKEGSARILFLYLRGSNGVFLVGGEGSGADEMIEAAGGIDLGSTLYKNPFTPINSEAILSLDPDHYLLMSAGLESVGGIEEFRKLPGIDPSIPVITVDDSLLLAFGARTPDLIRKLNRAIYG